jgi:hypothetical protein
LGQPPEPAINRAPLRRIRLTVYGISDRSTRPVFYFFLHFVFLFLRISWYQLLGNRDKQREKRYSRGIGGVEGGGGRVRGQSATARCLRTSSRCNRSACSLSSTFSQQMDLRLTYLPTVLPTLLSCSQVEHWNGGSIPRSDHVSCLLAPLRRKWRGTVNTSEYSTVVKFVFIIISCRCAG